MHAKYTFMQHEMKQRPMKLDDERWERLKQKVGNVTQWWLAMVDEELSALGATAPAGKVKPAKKRARPYECALKVPLTIEETAKPVEALPEGAGFEFERQAPAVPATRTEAESYEWGQMPEQAEVEPQRWVLDTLWAPLDPDRFELPFYKYADGRYLDSEGTKLPARQMVEIEKLVAKGKMAWKPVEAAG